VLAGCERERETFLKRIITGDVSYVRFLTPESKRASSEWRHQSSPRPKKVGLQASAGKMSLTVFWDCKGVILERYLEQRKMMNSERYSDMLKNQLKPAF
jgi:hypothetical protein